MDNPKTEPGTARYLSRTSETPTDGPGWRPARVDTVDTPEEFATIGHMRGWCHDTSKCKICTEQDRLVGMLRDTREQLVRTEGALITAQQRAFRAEVEVAHTARDLMVAINRADTAERRLDSIIEG